MSPHNDNIEWLQRGRQRSAVARVLRRPMIQAEIFRAARPSSPRIQLRDIWLILREMEERRLVTCLNPRMATGKLYTLTRSGRRATSAAFGIEIQPEDPRIDWRKYAWVARARTRRMVLIEAAAMPCHSPATAASIRRKLNAHYPIGLSPTIRALKELTHRRLLRLELREARTGGKGYRLTNTGRAIVGQLNQ